VGWCEGTAQVDAEQALLDGDERHGLHGWQDEEHRREVADDMSAEQHRLDTPGAVDGSCAQRSDAGDVESSAFEQQHREEQGGLVVRDPPPGPAAAGTGLRLGEHDPTGDDVGVAVDVVGVGVVAVVLLDLPAVAQPDQ
jgi:hypothetical protein